MNTLYLDLFSGISGDMFLGALLDLGVDFRRLEEALAKLGLRDYHLHVSRQQRAGITGTKFDVHSVADPQHAEAGHPSAHAQAHHHHVGQDHAPACAASAAGSHGHAPAAHPAHGRTFAEIRALVEGSALSPWVKGRSLAVFQRLAEAEGKIHGQPPDQVHFHEVGALDSIVDIVGGTIALELLGRPRVLASAVVEGTGWITCAHGRFPIPAPATLEVLSARGVRLSQCDEPHELVTPTGAALLAEFVEAFGPMRHLAVRRVGYGLGSRDHPTRPNVLRALLCEEGARAHDWETDTVALLQTNLDDIGAELLGRFLERALAAGALDVFYTPIQMKKNRPGVLLSVLCAEAEADRFTELILRETTAFGVRRLPMERRKLRREFKTVTTPHGPVPVKLGLLDGQVIQAAPEFEACKAIADQTGLPLKTVYDAARRALEWL